MKDFNGDELKLGDNVLTHDSNYAGFRAGTITAFTPKNVRVTLTNKVGSMHVQGDEVLRPPEQLVINNRFDNELQST